MSALAVCLKQIGCYVQGSDISNNTIKKDLELCGIKVFNKHNKNNIGGVDVVVYNSAIKQNNEELLEAKKKKLIILSRAELLSQIASDYKCVISIAGSHGKTTTTAMLYSCLKQAGLSPTLHIGGIIKGQQFGFIAGKKDFFITEACEYKDSFLKLKSDIGVILNIEKEHLDYFKTFDNEIKSFQKFATNSKKLVCYKNTLILKDDILTYGDENSNIVAKNIALKNHRYSFDCFINSKFFSKIELNAVGYHNIYNSLAVIGVCYLLGIEKHFIVDGLKNFAGVKRRFEIISLKDNYVVHDYAHHPTEIKKTISTFKENIGDKKLLVVFQPHTYSRTRTLFNEFLNCFDLCDEMILVKTYPAREKYDKLGSCYTLYKSLKNKGMKCCYVANFQIGIKKILKKIKENYAVLILGAGDIDDLAYSLKDKL